MKTPRIADFDPDADVKPLKSPLDGMPSIAKPQQTNTTAASSHLPAHPVKQERQEKEDAVQPHAPAPVKPQQRVVGDPAAAEAKAFDLNHPTEKSETFAFTFEEWLAINQLKTELIRLLGVDLKVTKIDIIRCALYLLVADYRTRGEHSFLVDRIKNKKPVDRIRRKNSR